jgi:hypothetical protein
MSCIESSRSLRGEQQVRLVVIEPPLEVLNSRFTIDFIFSSGTGSERPTSFPRRSYLLDMFSRYVCVLVRT